MSNDILRVVVVDDSAIVRAGLVTLLGVDQGLEVAGEAADGDAGVAVVRRTGAHVVLLDVRMPGRDGLSVVRELSSMTAVLMLTFSEEPEVIQRALAEGAVGYLVHGTFDADSLGSMVRAAASGAGAFSGPALDVLRRRVSAPAQEDRGSAPVSRAHLGLSRRQVEVMDLIAAGHSNTEIARELFLAEKTVKNHINQIFAALGVTSRAQAIVLWLDPGAVGN